MQPNEKHLEFVQNIITRMNSNSFQIKTWCITILSALLAIYATAQNRIFFVVALVATVLFWGLDTYYLLQERKFRGIYNSLISNGKYPNGEEIKPFEMRPDHYRCGKYSWWDVFTSTTIAGLYAAIIALLLLAYNMFPHIETEPKQIEIKNFHSYHKELCLPQSAPMGPTVEPSPAASLPTVPSKEKHTTTPPNLP